MRKVGRKMVLCLLIVTLFFGPISAVENGGKFNTDNLILTTKLDGGWLEEQEGVKILYLNGSYYEMGYQHGFLLKDEIQQSMRAQLVLCENNDYSFGRILDAWDTMECYLPEKYRQEMQGMADGAEMSFEQIAVLNTIPDLFNNFFEGSCCEIALWGDATVDGKLYHVRSYDWPFNLSDPETGTFLQENCLIIVRKPDNGYASVIPELAGDVGAYSGINEKGIAVGEDSCTTKDITRCGIGLNFRMRMVMDSATTAEEAIAILTSNRTCGTNFVISDANVPIGYALDQSANLSYVGTWNDPIEGTPPFWQIRDVVRRTPMYVDPACAAVEENRLNYDPSGFRGFLNAVTRRSNEFVFWTHYRALSEEIERRYGTLDLYESMSLLRDEYTGKTDPIFRFGINNYPIYQSFFQWVACPETGELLISFATSDKKACNNEVHYFDMFNLMDVEPHPGIRITRPQNSYFYIGLREIGLTLSKNTLIIGRTPIKVSVFHEENLDKVEFYLDHQLIGTVTEKPFAIMLDETAFFKHTIFAKAYYKDGNMATDQVNVMIFNI